MGNPLLQQLPQQQQARSAQPHAHVPLCAGAAGEPRRSIGGWTASLLCVVVAATSLGWLLVMPGQDWGIGLDADWILLFLATSSTLAAIWVERQIQNQLYLANRGDEAEATIRHVRHHAHRSEGSVVTYRFVTSEGVRIDGRSGVDDEQLKHLKPRSTATVLYDPQRPRNSMLIAAMWAVAWSDRI